MILVFFLFSFVNAQSTGFKFITSFEIKETEFKKNYEDKSTIYIEKSGQEIGKYHSFDFGKIILDKIEIYHPKVNYLIIAENQSEKRVYTFDDFNEDVNVLSPALIFEEITNTTGDTIVVPLQDDLEKLDLSFVDKELEAAIIERVQLQIQKLSISEKEKYFRSPSIIFPIDKSTKRWLSDVKRISIYELE